MGNKREALHNPVSSETCGWRHRGQSDEIEEEDEQAIKKKKQKIVHTHTHSLSVGWHQLHSYHQPPF